MVGDRGGNSASRPPPYSRTPIKQRPQAVHSRRTLGIANPASQSESATAANHPIRNVIPYSPVTLRTWSSVRLSYCEYAMEPHVPKGPKETTYSDATSVRGNTRLRVKPFQRCPK